MLQAERVSRKVLAAAGHTVIVIYKVCESLLEATILPYIFDAVCSDMYHNEDTAFWTADDHQMIRQHFQMVANTSDLNKSDAACYIPGALPAYIDDRVYKQAARTLILCRLLLNLPAVVIFLFFGAWSDAKGRKMPIVTPCIGPCLAGGCYLASTEVDRVKIPWLLAGFTLQGLFGRSPLMFMAVSSHVAEVSTADERAKRLARMLASNFIGMFLGALLAGLMQELSTIRTTISVVVTGYTICVMFVLFGIEDSVVSRKAQEKGQTQRELTEVSKKREPAMKKKPKTGKITVCRGLRDPILAAVEPREGNRRAVIVISLIGLTLNQCLKAGDQDITVLFVRKEPLSWPKSSYGYLMATNYGAMGLAMLLTLPLLSDVLLLADTNIVMLAILFKLLRTASAGFCTETWMVFVSFVAGASGALINPGFRSLMSKAASTDEVGKLFSIQASLENLSELVGSAIFTGIYAVTVHVLPAISYLAQAALYVCVLLAVLAMTYLIRRDAELMTVMLTAVRPVIPKPKPKVKKRRKTLMRAISQIAAVPSIMIMDMERRGIQSEINDDHLA